METKNVLSGIVSLTVVVICVAVIMMPVLADYTSTTRTYTNEGSYFIAPDGEDHTIVFGADAATVDGTTVEYPEGFGTGTSKSTTVAFGEDWVLRLVNGYTRLQLAGPPHAYDAESLSSDGITASITGTTLDVTINSTDYTLTDCQYYLAAEGEHVLCYNPYVKEDTQIVGGIYATGNTSDDVRYDLFEVVSGTIADGFTASVCRAAIFTSPSTTGNITSTFETNTETVSSDLLKVNSIVQDVTFVDDSTAEVTLTYLIVPETITYTNAEYLGSGNSALLSAIPVLVIVSLVIAAVGMLVVRNRD